jgi:hypothetical protein
MRIGLPRIRLRLLLPLAVAATAAMAVVFMGEGSAQTALQQKGHRNGKFERLPRDGQGDSRGCARERAGHGHRQDRRVPALRRGMEPSRSGAYGRHFVELVLERGHASLRCAPADARLAGRQVPGAHQPQAAHLSRNRSVRDLSVCGRPGPARRGGRLEGRERHHANPPAVGVQLRPAGRCAGAAPRLVSAAWQAKD